MNSLRPHSDCVVVGASFAGLACASSLARTGLRVTVLERKADPGEKLHTTGIIVKDAIDQIPLLDGLPPELVQRITGVRLYAPNLRTIDLAAPGYYFLATDTPNVMRWLAAQAEYAGARIVYRQPFEHAERGPNGFETDSLQVKACTRCRSALAHKRVYFLVRFHGWSPLSLTDLSKTSYIAMRRKNRSGALM